MSDTIQQKLANCFRTDTFDRPQQKKTVQTQFNFTQISIKSAINTTVDCLTTKKEALCSGENDEEKANIHEFEFKDCLYTRVHAKLL